MAPEQVNRQPIDRRVDVFACGIILHEMLTGKRLFAAPSELETLERVSNAQVVAPSVDNPEVPRALDQIVKRALSRDPGMRFGSGAEMAEALESLEPLMFSRRRMASFLFELFPDAWTVTCEVCGKQVSPGRECPECGTHAALDVSSSGGDHVIVATLPPPTAIAGSEPLPLPPPPPPRKRLELVKTPAESFPPTTDETVLPPIERPMPEGDSFDSMPVSASAPTRVDIDPTGARGEPQTAVQKTGGPRLYVVPKDDSSRMGLAPRRPAVPPPRPVAAGVVIVPPPPLPQFAPPRPATILPKAPERTAEPPPRPVLEPQQPTVLFQQPKPFSTTPVTLPMMQRSSLYGESAPPVLKPQGHFGRNLAIVLVVAGLVAVLLMSQLGRSPSPVVAMPVPAEPPKAVVVQPPKPVEPPKAVEKPAPPVQKPAPVVEKPAPPVEKPVAAARPEPVEKPARPARRRAPRRERVSESSAEPSTTVREGRIVDPFAGGD
jgi:serine/threonine-protein kinase